MTVTLSAGATDEVNTLDYYLASYQPGNNPPVYGTNTISNIFTMETRNTSDGTPFTATYDTDSNVASASNIYNEALNPKNGVDLGGSLPNSAMPDYIENTTVPVADFVIKVNNGVANGVYVIDLYEPGVGAGDWSGPNNSDTAPATTNFLTITVPEPATLTLLGLGGIGAMLQRRRKTA